MRDTTADVFFLENKNILKYIFFETKKSKLSFFDCRIWIKENISNMHAHNVFDDKDHVFRVYAIVNPVKQSPINFKTKDPFWIQKGDPKRGLFLDQKGSRFCSKVMGGATPNTVLKTTLLPHLEQKSIPN